ncbi:HlyU family transcriptional regulator [Salinispirillum sp. LH 10-3-1]|uniref:HlyU family transcriptional regulator n=1 Tax=Salinispirillum sp. LH 10-3-1 TaxID=2952525 RepID=A0AB38YE95_9GAMM
MHRYVETGTLSSVDSGGNLMFDWLKSLFVAQPQSTAASVQAEEEYNGFMIKIAPMPVGGQYRISAHISRVGAEEPSHHLIRADLLPDLDTAVEHTRLKARQAVDQLGDRLFSTDQ